MDELLKRTTSRCPECRQPCPAEVWRVDTQPASVHLRRRCATHGEMSVCISSDARFYWLSQGRAENSGCCEPLAYSAFDGSVGGSLGKNARAKGEAPFESLSTCLALIEIVDSCNLTCPTCYAN